MGTQNRRLGTFWPIDNSIEALRLSLQKKIDTEKTIEERRRLGQFATPTLLAKDIVAYGLKSLGFVEDIRFLDPAFGTGAFYSALQSLIRPEDIVKATAIEIDPMIANASCELWRDYNIQFLNKDFFELSPDGKYNLLICNPPYVRHHLIDASAKTRIGEKTKQVSGIRLSGLAGLYCHFLLQSVQWMEDRAIAGWLIPSEFMDVNYGTAIKEFLLTQVDLFRVHRFDPEELQFGDALVSSAVVWFRKKKPSYEDVLFSYGGSINSPKIVKSISIRTLQNESKWTRFPCSSQRKTQKTMPKLKDYFDVKRGIATGSNNFFIMDIERIRELGLPLTFFKPILPSARYVKANEITADEFGNPILPHRLFLLDCNLKEDEIRGEYPVLWNYLESGKESVAKGYLCRSRKVWYIQEKREVPLIICTYMGREKGQGDNAFRFILNNSDAIVTNSYLALYPKKSLQEKLARNPDLVRRIWIELNQLSSESLHDEGRIYGGGLRKIEPKELLNIEIPFMANLL